ncbi:class I SAM-dependent methyltransferase [Rheinheimera sp.]|uniref:class I SAM-dependent methyltransferase n=1 Tax=Rheinheimera sp. TaxID=1869214 RepID=UPI002632A500|nr:class I SAM-dependent methyltransferase [Rheinheimera sp.]MCA1929454.1 class I SAM-dependent methyltransferase [Rheinheimera sp.]
MSNDNDLREKTLESNRYVHSFLVGINEYQKSPHFRPENQQKVRGILLRLTSGLSNKKQMIDFGCGTGFIIALSHDLFDEVVGVDITREMMAQVDLSPGNIKLVEALAEKTPFAENQFDFATAYSFMDHLFDYREFLQEAYRVLKPGGVLYTDLNPNREFIHSMLQASAVLEPEQRSVILRREIEGALDNGSNYEQQFGLDATALAQAEPGKTLAKGFQAQEVLDYAKLLGFRTVEVEYEWYVDQGFWVNQQPEGYAQIIDQYLQSMLPVSAHFYKYLRFILTK